MLEAMEIKLTSNKMQKEDMLSRLVEFRYELKT